MNKKKRREKGIKTSTKTEKITQKEGDGRGRVLNKVSMQEKGSL